MLINLPKIKVLQVIKGLDIGALNGGAERFGLSLAGALDPARFEVEVCVFFKMDTPAAKRVEAQLQAAGIPFFYAADWHGNDRFNVYLQGMGTLRRHVNLRKVDVVNSHFQLGHLAALDLKTHGLARNAIRTVHNIPIREWSKGLYGGLRYQVLTKWAFPVLMDIEVGVSQAIVDLLNRHPGARLFHRSARLIYNAIPVETENGNQPLASLNGSTVGVVGRLAEQKGHRYLLEAVNLLKPALPNLQVWLIGDGELRAELEAQSTALGLEGNVRFLGRREDVPALLQQINLMVLPSLYEGLPTIIMEGMAAGVPVIATDIPGTRELVQDGVTGWLVPARDAHALAEKIRHVLEHPQAGERVRHCALEGLKRFSIQVSAGHYARLYEKLLGRGE